MGRTDAELVEASRRGDTAAFGEIVARYQRAVAATAYAGTRDRTLGEDVTQDAFVTAWRRMGSLEDPRKLPAWLCGIARNLARKAKVRREVPLDDELVGGTTPFEALGDREVDAIVASALARVPEAYREPLVLFYCEQQSVRAVADAMGISVAAAEQRLSRGRKQLRSEVEPLVERAAAPRKELAAMVAAIVLGIGASQVEAATTTTKGSTMLKFGIAAMLAAAVAGGGYYAATRSTSTSQAAPPPPSAEHAAFGAPDPMSIHHAAPARPQLATYDCNAVVDHLADLVMEDQPDANKLSPEDLKKAVEPVIAHMRGACRSMSFSQEYLSCLNAAQSMFDVAVGCQKLQPDGMMGSHARPSKDVVMIPDSGGTVAPYIGSDHSCASVAKHLVLFSTPDPQALHKLPDEQRAKVVEAIGRMHKTMPDQIEASCTQQEWPEAKRICMLAATTHEAAQNCM